MEEEQITYQKFIKQIIEERGRHGCGNVYHEKHHILPKCLGGEDVEENMIDLFAKEHFIAHKLLAKENPHNGKLQYAWWCMSLMKNKNAERYQCTPEEYEEAKIAMAKVKSKDMKGHKGYWKGKHRSEDFKRKDSEAKRGEKHPNYGKHHSEETRKRISEAIKGKNNPNYGKHRSEEIKKKTSKPVLCVETNVIYYGVREAERQTGICYTHIIGCCKGRLKTAGGFHWKYVN